MGKGFLVGEEGVDNVLKLDSGDSSTILWILKTPNCLLKISKSDMWNVSQ